MVSAVADAAETLGRFMKPSRIMNWPVPEAERPWFAVLGLIVNDALAPVRLMVVNDVSTFPADVKVTLELAPVTCTGPDTVTLPPLTLRFPPVLSAPTFTVAPSSVTLPVVDEMVCEIPPALRLLTALMPMEPLPVLMVARSTNEKS